MLSVTTYLTTDIAAIPLFWIVPLALYLLTFILAFARRRLYPRRAVRNLAPIVVLLLALILLSEATEPVFILVPLHLAGFFVLALTCHDELAQARPAPSRLTEFYLALAVGGALGGVFNGLLAPLLFNGLVEYPAVLVAACLLRYRRPSGGTPPSWRDLGWPALLGAGTAAALVAVRRLGMPPGKLVVATVLGPAYVLCATFLDRPLRFALGVTALFLAGLAYEGVHGRTLYRERSFFGVHRVAIDPERRYRQLVHGSTVHGRQSIDPERLSEPLTYYHRTGPIGRVFGQFSGRFAKPHVGLVGLGAGSLAAYGEAGQELTFFEIDPVVARIAGDPEYFTFLHDCPARVHVRLGDARLSLGDEPDGRFGMLVIDAFSSDAIPLHLLTREALQLYLRKLAPDGVLAFHVSNRYLKLEDVLADLARDAGLHCYSRNDLNLDDDERAEGKSPSQWVVLVRQPEHFGALRTRMWDRLPGREGVTVWTDQFSNLLTIFKWE
jgi:hypothetical protein